MATWVMTDDGYLMVNLDQTWLLEVEEAGGSWRIKAWFGREWRIVRTFKKEGDALKAMDQLTEE